jgi:hypothetical protein
MTGGPVIIHSTRRKLVRNQCSSIQNARRKIESISKTNFKS